MNKSEPLPCVSHSAYPPRQLLVWTGLLMPNRPDLTKNNVCAKYPPDNRGANLAFNLTLNLFNSFNRVKPAKKTYQHICKHGGYEIKLMFSFTRGEKLKYIKHVLCLLNILRSTERVMSDYFLLLFTE